MDMIPYVCTIYMFLVVVEINPLLPSHPLHTNESYIIHSLTHEQREIQKRSRKNVSE